MEVEEGAAVGREQPPPAGGPVTISDDDDELDEASEGNRLLGFIFGNVDDSGDLDIDYLDEDAKEHLTALADKLGQSLTDIDLSIKSTQTPDVANQDYDNKAEDAVDFKDIDEQYEGPETETVTEADHLLPKKDFVSAVASGASLGHTNSVFDDENYDEDVEVDKDDSNSGVQTVPVSGDQAEYLTVDSHVFSSSLDDLPVGILEDDRLTADLLEFEEGQEPDVLKDSHDSKNSTPLPVLCMEDGVPILRFSEIFGIHEPLKKGELRGREHDLPKEKCKPLHVSDVEDDEEAFLKSCCPGFSVVIRAHVAQDDFPVMMADDSEMADFFVHGIPAIPHQVGGHKDSCLSSQAMKDDVAVDLSVRFQAPCSPEFLLLDQQNWEDFIIWDNSPAASDRSVESHDLFPSGYESLVNSDAESRTVARTQIRSVEARIDSEKDHKSLISNSSIIVESFDSRSPAPTLSLGSTFHPQLLRLETQSELDHSKFLNARDVAEEFRRRDANRRFSKIIFQNKDLLEGSWLEQVIWDPDKPVGKPKLLLDLQDEQMLFEVLDIMDAKQLQLRAGAMIANRSIKSGIRESSELPVHGGLSGVRLSIANDKFYSNRKSSQQQKSCSKKRTSHGIKVLHSESALKLQTMKPKLSNKDIANFHRPKALWYPHDNEVAMKEQGSPQTCGPMKIILKSLGGKGCKLNVDAEETISSVITKASKKLDFKASEAVKIFYHGKELEEWKSLAEQNVRPNSLLHLVRTKIHLLARAQKIPGENRSLRPPGAFKKKSDLSVKDGHVFLMEYCEERPLLLGNIGMGVRICTYYQKSSPSDQTGTQLHNENSSLGTVLSLDPADKSPFIGEIKPGCFQSCLETNMYRAPIFQHKLPSTDYLLIRSAKGKFSIRRIDRINVVGQQEPHMEVMSPGTKGLQTYVMNRLLVYMYREFSALEKRGSLPLICADEVSAQFPNISESNLRKRLKHFADLQQTNGELFWIMRPNFRIPLEAELRRMVIPESVCAYESMLAGQYRLKRLGIVKLVHPTGLSMAMNQLPDEAIALAAASHIERELLITPWNLSCNFVACTNQFWAANSILLMASYLDRIVQHADRGLNVYTKDRENIERLEITGVGDPSGRGLGFSFVRTSTKAPISTAMLKKKTAVSQSGSTVTGTDADLRRLSMDAAREVLLKFNVPDDLIAKQTRWHRIAMIRKLSSEQAASGIKVDPTTIGKFARGQRMSFLQLQQQTRDKCQEIWDRQVQNLSATDGEENDSDSEANSDLDSFAGDLENLLDAECEEDEAGNYESKQGKGDTVRGLKMRRHHSQSQAEEIEDEAAEAAKLCRMLMDDDESDWKKKKLSKTVGDELVSVGGSQRNAEWRKKPGKVDKLITHVVLPHGSHTSKGDIQDMKDVESFLAKKSLFRNSKGMKMTDPEQMGLLHKKVKIMEDGAKDIKERKSAREKFACGACGKPGHMRTNKNCPKYGEDTETQAETADLDPSTQSRQKPLIKNPVQKVAAKRTSVESTETEKLSSKIKSLPVKFKCRTPEEHMEKITPEGTPVSDQPASTQAETGNKTISIISKGLVFNKARGDDAHKPAVVIKPPTDAAEKEQPRKKIIIKHPRETNFEAVGHDPENRKTKKIAELSSFEKQSMAGMDTWKNVVEEKRWQEEQEKRRNAERQKEEAARRRSVVEEQEKLDGLTKYQDILAREWEEEEWHKANKKKKKRPAEMQSYLVDSRARQSAKRRPSVESARYGNHAPPAKRRRGGEVGLANSLESIVEALKRAKVSYYFLKPVTKKEAPDYAAFVERPMDLSTIREKARNMEYKSRHDFRRDVCQITYNAHIYNDNRNLDIPPLADQLLEMCDSLLEERSPELSEAEASIDP